MQFGMFIFCGECLVSIKISSPYFTSIRFYDTHIMSQLTGQNLDYYQPSFFFCYQIIPSNGILGNKNVFCSDVVSLDYKFNRTMRVLKMIHSDAYYFTMCSTGLDHKY